MPREVSAHFATLPHQITQPHQCLQTFARGQSQQLRTTASGVITSLEPVIFCSNSQQVNSRSHHRKTVTFLETIECHQNSNLDDDFPPPPQMNSLSSGSVDNHNESEDSSELLSSSPQEDESPSEEQYVESRV